MDKIRPLASQGLAYGQKSLDKMEQLHENAADRAAGLVEGFGLPSALQGMNGGGDTGFDVADTVAKRNKTFVTHFTRRITKMEDKVGSASTALRGTVLNSVIMCDASARSEIPDLERAIAQLCEQSKARLSMFESRSRAMPQLRHQLLEACAEKKLQMERQYLSDQAPTDDRRAAEVKALMEKSGKVKRRMQPPPPSLLGYN